MMRRIAIDIETSGLAPASGGEIILICAVELLEGRRLGAQFHSRIKPSRPLRPLVEELTDIRNTSLANAPNFVDIAEHFIDFTAGSELVCINSAFDSSFVNRALKDSGLATLEPERFIDLLSKLPPAFLEQGSEGIYRYTKISRNRSAKPSEEVARLYWALVERCANAG
jgi:DNA polymerase III epsilon subunit family exonuclease